MLEPSNKAIDYGVQRFIDFVSVQADSDRKDRVNAVSHLALSLGIDDDKWDYLVQSLSRIIEPPNEGLGWCIVGVLMGLFIAEYDR